MEQYTVRQGIGVRSESDSKQSNARDPKIIFKAAR